MRPLLKLLGGHQTSDLDSVRTFVWLLSNLCRGIPKPDFNLVGPTLQTLNELIYHSDEEVVKDACWALSYLISGPNENMTVIDALNDTGIRRLVKLLEHPNTNVQLPCIENTGNTSRESFPRGRSFINNCALPSLLTLLSSSNEYILHEACWIISNIAEGTMEQIQAVIDSGIIPKLIQMLRDGHLLQHPSCEAFSRSIRRQVVLVFANAVNHGSKKQIKYFLNQGCIPLLSDF